MAFQVVLTDAIAQITTLRDRAANVLESYTQDQPEFDAAYQIWQDLDRAYDELVRTHYAITEGLV